MKKRIISSIMCLAMLLSLLPVAAFAAEPGDTIDVAVTEVGAFPTAEAFKSYVNNTYYLNNGDGVDDVAPNTMFVRLSKALPTGYSLCIMVRSEDDKSEIEWRSIESPNSFAYFANEAFGDTTKTYNVRLGIFKGTWQQGTEYWYTTDGKWDNDRTKTQCFKVKPVASKTAAPGTITLTETGLASGAKGTIDWTNATSAESGITAKIGAPVSFTVEAPEGYTVKSVTVGGEVATAKDGKYSFVMADKTAAVAVTYEAETVSTVPVLKDPGFNMNADTAKTAINNLLGSIRQDAVEVTDVDTNTMYIGIDNMDAEKSYELVVTKGTTPIYTEENLTEKTETVVYFTFNEDGGSATEERIADGDYTFTLYEVEGTTKTAVGDPAALKLVKVTFAPNEGTLAQGTVDQYLVANGTLTLPAAPTRTGYTFVGWSDGETIVSDEAVISDTVTLTAQWRDEKVEDPEAAEPEFGTIPESVSTAVPAIKKTTASAAPLLTDGAVVKATNDVLADKDISDLLTEAGVGYDKVHVEVYLQVEPKSFTAADATAGTPAQLKVEITPMYKVVATGTDKEDVTVTSIPSAKLEADVSAAVTIEFALPENFVEIDGSTQKGTAYVAHKGYVNEAEVVAVAATGSGDTAVPAHQKATFTNTHGFSEFTVYSANPAAATYNGVDYETLADAVKAVTDSDVTTAAITVNKNLTADDAVTVNKAVKITLSAKDNTVTLIPNLLVAGSNVERDRNDTQNVYTFTAKTTPPPSGGSSGGSSTSVSIPSTSNGKVTVSNNNAKKGDTVTITLTPNTGYVVDTVTVTDSKGNTVTVSKTDDTHYTFTMPEGRVTVKATFKQADAPSSTGFTDVAADAYYADAVKWAVEKGITNGLTATTFGPNNSCTRGQMVTFLWRAAGSPAATATNSFTDVASSEYYYDAVLWAVEKGITNGTSATTFSPNATVNRGQTVTFLYRYAESPAATGETSFTDVAADAYYANAVKWAVAEEITNGTSSTTFSPASNCTRGQIVTFLYRQIAE